MVKFYLTKNVISSVLYPVLLIEKMVKSAVGDNLFLTLNEILLALIVRLLHYLIVFDFAFL